ncbi:unnamed protein product [Nippostrongylus brasiliensis]|uniref:COesterase domain-containing protein n=1 Tax=Nippostrongylus brasiliensis TaxID=27835 RepID=A0A0N4YMI7_NIPBR|nr:unnamed protein product [Nippostrongylus brasiliensis]
MWYILLVLLIRYSDAMPVMSPFLVGNDAFLTKEYINAITAYGPGLGVFTPYSYVDLSYDNIPFIGKIPTLGKEGTSSRLGISPFYPPQGNPSNPFPPLYRYSRNSWELVLPSELEKEKPSEKPTDPFGESVELQNGLVAWPSKNGASQETEAGKEGITSDVIQVDKVDEKNVKDEELAAMKPSPEGRPKNPFRSKRVKRMIYF